MDECQPNESRLEVTFVASRPLGDAGDAGELIAVDTGDQPEMPCCLGGLRIER